MNIYTRYSEDDGIPGEGQGVIYGKAVPKGQPPIRYDPQTKEGYDGIAAHWGEEEAIIALMRDTLIDAKHVLFSLLENRMEFGPGQVLSTIRDIDKAIGARRKSDEH